MTKNKGVVAAIRQCLEKGDETALKRFPDEIVKIIRERGNREHQDKDY